MSTYLYLELLGNENIRYQLEIHLQNLSHVNQHWKLGLGLLIHGKVECILGDGPDGPLKATVQSGRHASELNDMWNRNYDSDETLSSAPDSTLEVSADEEEQLMELVEEELRRESSAALVDDALSATGVDGTAACVTDTVEAIMMKPREEDPSVPEVGAIDAYDAGVIVEGGRFGESGKEWLVGVLKDGRQHLFSLGRHTPLPHICSISSDSGS